MPALQPVNANEFFRETTLRISSSLHAGHALESLCVYLKDFIPFDFSGMYYRTETDIQDIYGVAEYRLGEGLLKFDKRKPAFSLDKKVFQRLEQEYGPKSPKEAIIRNNPDEVPHEILEKFAELRGCSALKMDLAIQGKEIGTIIFLKHGYDQFLPEHAKLLESIHDPIAIAMSNARRFQELERLKDRLTEENRAISREMEQISGNRVIGADFGLSHVMEMVTQVSPMASPVLLTGETGTGKEVIANAIHMESPRRDGPLVRVQCGAIPDSLLDSELFGHEKGAFTGAIQMKRGRFERAHTGTLFLDEIGELTLEAQVKLLRVLQEKEFERIGGSKTLKVDVRVIVATHRDLRKMVDEGTFREDLWFRLHVFPIHIPPLRSRKEDIAALTQYFIDRKCREMNLNTRPSLGSSELDRLVKYNWPGNVRELQNVIERGIILGNGRQLRLPPINIRPFEKAEASPGNEFTAPAGRSLDAVAGDYIRYVLRNTSGRIEGRDGAAELLAVNPSTLRARMRKLGIPFGRESLARP